MVFSLQINLRMIYYYTLRHSVLHILKFIYVRKATFQKAFEEQRKPQRLGCVKAEFLQVLDKRKGIFSVLSTALTLPALGQHKVSPGCPGPRWDMSSAGCL